MERFKELGGDFSRVTGCSAGDHGGSAKVTGSGSLTIPLEVTVHGVVAVGLDGIGLVARPVLEDGSTVGSGRIGIV